MVDSSLLEGMAGLEADILAVRDKRLEVDRALELDRELGVDKILVDTWPVDKALLLGS